MRRLALLLGIALAAAVVWLFWPRAQAEPETLPPLAREAVAVPEAGTLEREAAAAPTPLDESAEAGAEVPALPAHTGWTVRVEDSSAVPIPAALVWLADEFGVSRVQGRTGADGRLVVAVQEWAALAGASKEGFAPEQAALPSKSPGMEVVLRLAPSRRLSGTIWDWRNRPVGGVRVLAAAAEHPITPEAVAAVRENGDGFLGPFTLATSAEDGSFTIAHPCPGRRVRMLAGGAGHASDTWDTGGYSLDDVTGVGITVKRIYGARWRLAAPGAEAAAEAGAVAALRKDVTMKLEWKGSYDETPRRDFDPALVLAGVPLGHPPSEDPPLFLFYALAGRTQEWIQGYQLELALPGRGAQTVSLPLFQMPDGFPPLRTIPLGEDSTPRGEVEVSWTGPALFLGAPTMRPMPGWAWLEFEPLDDATRAAAAGTLQAAVGGFPLQPVRVAGIPYGMYRVSLQTLHQFRAPAPDAAEARVLVGELPSEVRLDLYGMGFLRIEPFYEDGLPYTGPAGIFIAYRHRSVASGPFLVPGLPAGRIWCGVVPWHDNTAVAGWADVLPGTLSTWQVRVPRPGGDRR